MLGLMPLKYNVRNIGRRRLRSVLTMLGIALVVAVCVLMVAFAQGLRLRLLNTASKDNVILLSANAMGDVTRSSIHKGTVDTLSASFSGARKHYGQPLVSPEVHLGAKIRLNKDDENFYLGVVRGVHPVAFQVHPQVEIIAGTGPSRGRKLMVGTLVAANLGVDEDELYVGRKIWFEQQEWEIAGIFRAAGAAFQSEIWCDADDIITAKKGSAYSSISMVLENEEAYKDLAYLSVSRLDLQLILHRETEYYAGLMKSLQPISIVVYVMLGLVVIGGILGGMNTMYTAVLRRFREFSMLRTLGFSRMGIVAGLCIESVFLSGAGGLLGALGVNLANGMAMRFVMGTVAIRIGVVEMAVGIGIGLLIGLVGSILPGIRSMRMRVVDGIRAV